MKKQLCSVRHNRVIGMNRLRMKEEISEERIMFRHIRVIQVRTESCWKGIEYEERRP